MSGCPAGGTVNTRSCAYQCNGGYSQSGSGPSTSCTQCLAGYYSAAGDGSCSQCLAGSYSAAGATSCTLCPTGSASSAGGTSITSCIVSGGYYIRTGTTNLNAPELVPQGYYRAANTGAVGTVSNPQPTKCPTGSGSTATGGQTIASCTVSGGYYIPTGATGAALNTPLAVPVNYYRATNGAVGVISDPQPTQCPANSGSTTTGNSTKYSCILSTGYYIPSGATGPALDVPVQVPAGYYRDDRDEPRVGVISNPQPAACGGSSWSPAGVTSCTPWNICVNNEYQTNTPSTTVDRTCATCRPCTTPANADDSSFGCSGSVNRTCVFTCKTGYFRNAAATGCSQWSNCGNNQYQTLAPSATFDRVCETCRDCSGKESRWNSNREGYDYIRTSLIETYSESCSNNNGTSNRQCQACPSIFMCGGQKREFYIYHHARNEYIGDQYYSYVDSKAFNQSPLISAQPYRWTYDTSTNVLQAVNNSQRPDIPYTRGARVAWANWDSIWTRWNMSINSYYSLDATKRGTHVTISNFGDSPYKLYNCRINNDLGVWNLTNGRIGYFPECEAFSLIFVDTVSDGSGNNGWTGGWTPTCSNSSFCPPIGQTFTVPPYNP